jgi:hypothetical protein
MAAYAEIVVFPVLPIGMRGAFAAETGWMLHRLDAFERSRRRAGINLERVYLTNTPQGPITIAYHEGVRKTQSSRRSVSESDYGAAFTSSQDIFDEDFMTRVKVLHGLTQEGMAGLLPRQLYVDYNAEPEVRQPGVGFALAILPNMTNKWLELCSELQGGRHRAFSAFNERLGCTVHRVGLYRDTAVDIACIYLEGNYQGLPTALLGQGDFENWLAQSFRDVYGEVPDARAITLSDPVWDWVDGGQNIDIAPLFTRMSASLPE